MPRPFWILGTDPTPYRTKREVDGHRNKKLIGPKERGFKESPKKPDWICNRYPGYPYLHIDVDTNQLCCKERPNTLNELKDYAGKTKSIVEDKGDHSFIGRAVINSCDKILEM